MTFSQMETTKKGDLGEHIATRYLRQQGWIIYVNDVDAPHPIDLCGIIESQICLFDIKTKARRRNYDDTGMDLSDWYHYHTLQQANPGVMVILIWVDEVTGTIYGRSLNTLSDPSHCHVDGDIIYFNLDQMATIATLTDEEIAQLGGNHATVAVTAA